MGTREYARGDIHTNPGDSSHALVKRGIVGIYHNVSREYLHRYLWQFDFMWNKSQAERWRAQDSRSQSSGRKAVDVQRPMCGARFDLLELLDHLNPTIAKLTQAIEEEVKRYPAAQRLRTHPGVGPLTALGFVLIFGKADRELSGTGDVGEVEGESAMAGDITKQGNSLLRFLLVEAAQVMVRSLPEWRSKYCHLTMRRERKIAKVAMARKLD